MRNTLIDAGPLIALFSKNDRYHDKVLSYLKEYRGRLVTTWPVITETCHLLDFEVKAQLAFLRWLQRGAVTIYDISFAEIDSLITLTEKYHDVPMDLADASLILVAHALRTNEIITIDADFYVYRTIAKEAIRNVFLNP